MIGAAPDLSKGAVFYHDPKGYTKLLLHGIEFHILCAYMALFSYIDNSSGSALTAAAAIWIIDVLLVAIRQHFGTVNVSNKTLLDSKFLI